MASKGSSRADAADEPKSMNNTGTDKKKDAEMDKTDDDKADSETVKTFEKLNLEPAMSESADAETTNTEPANSAIPIVNPHLTATRISTMHVNQMPDDCLRLILEELGKNSQLSEMLQKAFVCNQWFDVVAKIMRTWKLTSLKLFESERSFVPYRQYVLDELKLQKIDKRFELFDGENGAAVHWKQQDHVMLRKFSGVSLSVITTALEIFFADITHLVINTFDIDQIEVLKAFPELTTLTFVELPESRKIQEEIWAYMAENMPKLRHFHLFHANSFEVLDVEQIRPVLARLESFTLDRYQHDNCMQLLSCLDPKICRRICMGKFPCYQEAANFRQKMTNELPALAPHLIVLENNPANERNQRFVIDVERFFGNHDRDHIPWEEMNADELDALFPPEWFEAFFNGRQPEDNQMVQMVRELLNHNAPFDAPNDAVNFAANFAAQDLLGENNGVYFDRRNQMILNRVVPQLMRLEQNGEVNQGGRDNNPNAAEPNPPPIVGANQAGGIAANVNQRFADIDAFIRARQNPVVEDINLRDLFEPRVQNENDQVAAPVNDPDGNEPNADWQVNEIYNDDIFQFFGRQDNPAENQNRRELLAANEQARQRVDNELPREHNGDDDDLLDPPVIDVDDNVPQPPNPEEEAARRRRFLAFFEEPLAIRLGVPENSPLLNILNNLRPNGLNEPLNARQQRLMNAIEFNEALHDAAHQEVLRHLRQRQNFWERNAAAAENDNEDILDGIEFIDDRENANDDDRHQDPHEPVIRII